MSEEDSEVPKKTSRKILSVCYVPHMLCRCKRLTVRSQYQPTEGIFVYS